TLESPLRRELHHGRIRRDEQSIRPCFDANGSDLACEVGGEPQVYSIVRDPDGDDALALEPGCGERPAGAPPHRLVLRVPRPRRRVAPSIDADGAPRLPALLVHQRRVGLDRDVGDLFDALDPPELFRCRGRLATLAPVALDPAEVVPVRPGALV